nr:hypothetical protein Iba_chr05eCG7770 [Ipomoea batatas]
MLKDSCEAILHNTLSSARSGSTLLKLLIVGSLLNQVHYSCGELRISERVSSTGAETGAGNRTGFHNGAAETSSRMVSSIGARNRTGFRNGASNCFGVGGVGALMLMEFCCDLDEALEDGVVLCEGGKLA